MVKKRISVVTPCFNEEENVPLICAAVRDVFREHPEYDYEHIFIDNASTDRTVPMLKEIAQTDSNVKLIVNARNFGWTRSPYYGLLQAQGNAVILIVADFQDPPHLIHEFLAKWEAGYKIVIGVKHPVKEFFLLELFRKLYYFLVTAFSDVELIPNFTGYGLYDQQIIQILRQINNPNPYLRGIISEVGFEKAIIYTQIPSRQRGLSKSTFFKLYDLAMLGFTSHTKIPLRIATILGFLLGIACFAIAFIYLVLKLLYWSYFPAGIAAVVIGLFFLVSVQLFFIGLMGEYVLSINTNTRNYPLVVEKERINFTDAVV